MHYRMIRDRIIDFSEWPSRQLPIPFVDGDSYYIEGRQYTKSFIHEARDAQKCVNYSRPRLLRKLRIVAVNNGLGLLITLLDMNKTGEIQSYKWAYYALNLTQKLDKCHRKCHLGTYLPADEQCPSSTQDIREILGFSETEALR